MKLFIKTYPPQLLKSIKMVNPATGEVVASGLPDIRHFMFETPPEQRKNFQLIREFYS